MGSRNLSIRLVVYSSLFSESRFYVIVRIFFTVYYYYLLLTEKNVGDKKVMFYTRYVDEILMIYKAKHTAPQTIHNPINKTHPNLQFTPTHEHTKSISFLDLFQIRQTDKIETDIFRKPTTTDKTINYTSNHSTEHKMAAFCYVIYRMILIATT
jgi:hypothetical protein